ncbi:hypothetical protein [Bacillus cereus]|uniref:hypothetical protein n=1 Tax=Bacillus cereus TaxID=1396 RepID=UPI0039E1EE0A
MTQTISEANKGALLKEAWDAGAFMTKEENFVVEGKRMFDQWYIKAKQLIFKPNSELIFTKMAQEHRGSFFIVAEEFICEDLNAPGSIVWEHDDVPKQAAASGQAGSGVDATSDGQDGGPGEQGNIGAKGEKGISAPDLTIIVEKVPGSGTVIDFSGQQGGQGGEGQKGGKGGHGGTGKQASSSLVDCKSGAGDGGHGGNGGKITIISPYEIAESINQKFRVIISGGQGGEGGIGGTGGDGGTGGKGGDDDAPYCRGNGKDGNTGATGNSGNSGGRGEKGRDGDMFHGTTTKEIFDKVIGNV